MSSFTVVVKKAAGVIRLAGSMLAKAVSSLSGAAEKLSLQQIESRLDGALRALRGEAQIAQDIIDSYTFDPKTRVATFTVPAGVTDVAAMKVLDGYFRRYFPDVGRGAICTRHLEWLEKVCEEFPSYCMRRYCSQARQITITALVDGTRGKARAAMEVVLRQKSLVFADPRDQVLAAAIHACKHRGKDLFDGAKVCCAIPQYAVQTDPRDGVGPTWYDDLRDFSGAAASGVLEHDD